MIEVTLASTHKPCLVLAGPATLEMQKEIDHHAASKVEYLGVLTAEQIPEVIRSSDVGLVLFKPLPNHFESQPTKIYEYWLPRDPL